MKILQRMAVLLLLIGLNMSDIEAKTFSDTIKGVVIDSETENPVIGAVVYIEELDYRAVTNTRGEFEFSDISPGSYTLIVESVGYTTGNLQFDYPDDSYLVMELDSAIFRIDEVIVTSSPLGRNIYYQPAQSFNLHDLHNQLSASMSEVLDGSPGVSMRSLGSAPSRPVIRGLDDERVLILQNGERMGDFSATSSDHAVSLDPLAIERVEIVRGPASLLYGSNALGGVVNMFTRDIPQNWVNGMSGSVTGHGASMNKLGSGMIRGQYGTESWAFSGHGIFRESGDIRTPDGMLPSTWVNSYSFGSGLGYRSDNLQTGVSFSIMNNDYGIPEELDDPDESLESRNKRYNLQSVSLWNFDNGFLENAELRLHANYNQLDDIEIEVESDGEVEEELEKRLEQNSFSSTLTFQQRAISNIQGVFGLNVQYRDLKISGEEILAPNAQSLNLAAFVFEELDLSNTVSLLAGGRFEFQQINLGENEAFSGNDISSIDKRSDFIFSGSAGLNIRPFSGWEAGIQLARAFRNPSIEELYSDAPHFHVGAYEIGDPDLKSEVSLGSDLFVKYRNNRIYVEVAGYLNRINNYIMYFPTGEIHGGSGLPVYRYTPSDALLYGFEFALEGKIAGDLSGGVSLDYVHGTQRDDDRTYLSFIPPFRTNLSLRYDNNTWWAGTGLRLVSKQDRVAPFEESTDAYSLLNFNAGYRLGQGITFSVRADNILNVSYRDHLTRVEERDNPMPGRNLNAVVRWDF